MSSEYDRFLPARSQFHSNHRLFFYAFILPVRNIWTAPFFFFFFFFLRKQIKKNFASPQFRFLDAIFMQQLSRRFRLRYTVVATLPARWRYGTRSRSVAMSKSRKFVSKMTHGFFITINSMILYFIHIDDFPLNGHPPIVH